MTRTDKKKLGDILVERNIISRAQLADILTQQKTTNLRLGELLIKKGIATEEDVLSSLAEHYGIEYVKKLDFADSDGILKKLPHYFLNRNRLAPYNVKEKTILVGIVDPLNLHPFDDLKMLLPDHQFLAVLTSDDEIQRIVQTYYAPESSDTHEVIDQISDDFESIEAGISETEDLLDVANDAPIIRLVNKFITQAVHERASDIHIESFEQDLAIRFRIDGILYRKGTPPKKLQNAIISRVKIMANLNIAENRLPQDGRIQIKIGGKDIDIRVSIFPTHYGERVVLRLLNKTDMKFDLDAIGFDKHNLDVFKHLIDKPHGIIIVTGPTGSGKTTTLYSALMRLNTEDVNILTVEDPIEYQLDGVGQMQVKSKIDLTFAAGLRSILRQDPDIIMVGEVRDYETAEIAVQAALTGHRVFTTLHTNDTASAITRLIDMGVEPFLIASSVNAFLAQRLVRTICPHCKVPHKPTASELREVGITPAMLKKGKIFRGKGCIECLNTGYLGRTGIYELMPVTNEIRKCILDRSDAQGIKSVALRQGMIPLVSDGAMKVMKGITSIEEVLRVSGSLI